MSHPLRAWLDPVLTPPFPEPLVLDLTPVAGKSTVSLAWRRLRPLLDLAWHRQLDLQQTAIKPGQRRLLWIYQGVPQIGDALMDLSSRMLLPTQGLRCDLYIDRHLQKLFQADGVFENVWSDVAALDASAYDLVIVDSFKARCLRIKHRHLPRLRFVTMRGYFLGPEFNRIEFSFRRMQQLLQISASAAPLPWRPYLMSSAADRALGAALAIPSDAIGIAIGGAVAERSYPHWPQVVRRLAALMPTPSIVLFGSANAHAMRDEIVQICQQLGLALIDAVDRYELTQVFEIMQRCRLLLAADGGLLHLAHAAQRPTVGLFDRHIAPALRCTADTNCHALQSNAAVGAITVDAVLASVYQALGQS